MSQVINRVGTIFSTDNINESTVTKIKSALEFSGLDPKIASELSKRYCFIRAKNRLVGDGIIDEVGEDDKRLTFQLSKKYVEDNKLTYEYGAQVWFDKGSETVGADDAALLEKAVELFAHYGEAYLPSDTSKLVRRIFDAQKGLVPLRHSGVVYFVPEEKQDILEKISLFVTAIGGDIITAEIGIDNKQVREKTTTMLVEGVKNDLEKIVNELKALEQNSEPLSKRKAKNRHAELLGQLERIKTFARSLQVDSGTLLKSVKSSEFDLALVAECDIDVLAALAQNGKITGAIAQIAKTAFEGSLPVVSDPRVQRAIKLVDAAVPDLTDTPVIRNVPFGVKQEVLAEVG